jgi:hypothetical protein
MDMFQVQRSRQAKWFQRGLFLVLLFLASDAHACPKPRYGPEAIFVLYGSQLFSVVLIALMFRFDLVRVAIVFIPYAALETKLWLVLRLLSNRLPAAGIERYWIEPTQVAILVGGAAGALLYSLGQFRYFRRSDNETRVHVMLVPSFVIVTLLSRGLWL